MRKLSIIYVDMDDTLCDYRGAYDRAKIKNPEVVYPQSVPHFFENLEPIKGAVESVNDLREIFNLYILTAPSYKNPLCYTEKRLWIERRFDLDLAKKLIISSNKGLLKGSYLIDDMVNGKGQENFEGEIIQFGSVQYPNWKSILKFFSSSEQQ